MNNGWGNVWRGLCDVWFNKSFAYFIVFMMWIQRSTWLQPLKPNGSRLLCLEQGWNENLLYICSVFLVALWWDKLLFQSGHLPFLKAGFSQALSWLKDSPGELAWKSVPEAKKMRRARLKYQARIYALDLRFNNATENQYLIKQMMEKNTAWEMRLLHCFQTSLSQRGLGWQDGLATGLTRASGMQTIAVPLIPILLSRGLLAIFY